MNSFVNDPMKVPFNEIKDGIIYISKLSNILIKDSDFVMYKLIARNAIIDVNYENDYNYQKNRKKWIVISDEIKFTADSNDTSVLTKVDLQIDIKDKCNSTIQKLVDGMVFLLVFMIEI